MANKTEIIFYLNTDTEPLAHTDDCNFSTSEFPSKRDIIPIQEETPKTNEKLFVNPQPNISPCPNQEPRTVTRKIPRIFPQSRR